MANEVGQGKGQEEIAAEKRLKAFELRKQGLPYREIGAMLGVTTMTAHNYVHKILEELHEQTLAHGRKYVEVELERLDNMIKPLLPRSADGEIAAQEMILKIMSRRTKYLGLDEPEKHEHSGTLTLEQLILQSIEDEKKEKAE